MEDDLGILLDLYRNACACRCRPDGRSLYAARSNDLEPINLQVVAMSKGRAVKTKEPSRGARGLAQNRFIGTRPPEVDPRRYVDRSGPVTIVTRWQDNPVPCPSGVDSGLDIGRVQAGRRMFVG